MVGLVLAAAVACPLHPTSLDVVLGTRALPGLPPDLARQLAKHPREFHQGAEAAAAYPQALHSVGAGVTLEETLLAQCDRLVAAIRSRATFASVTAGFGALAHLVSDLYFPPPPTAPAEAKAFSSFVLSRLSRIPVVFYAGYENVPFASRDTLWQLILAEARRTPPLWEALREDFLRAGGPQFWNSLDDRSTTFGVASVSVNRALSLYVALGSWIWHHAGGLVKPFPGNDQRILVWKGELKPREESVPHLRIR